MLKTIQSLLPVAATSLGTALGVIVDIQTNVQWGPTLMGGIGLTSITIGLYKWTRDKKQAELERVEKQAMWHQKVDSEMASVGRKLDELTASFRGLACNECPENEHSLYRRKK